MWTTILRGFKVSVAVLDAFLAANGQHGTDGYPPFYQEHPDEDPVSVLLFTKITKAGGTADRNKFRVMIPSRRNFNKSTVAYVTYSWVTVYAHRELRLDEDLPEDVPAGFEDLRKEITSFSHGVPDGDRLPDEGRMGLFVVLMDGDSGGWYLSPELRERGKIPQYCDQCDAVFTDGRFGAFDSRQQHRIEVHGSKEGTRPLPND